MASGLSRPTVLAVFEGRPTEASGGEMRDLHLLEGIRKVADVSLVTLPRLPDEARAKMSARYGAQVIGLGSTPRGPARSVMTYARHWELPYGTARLDRAALRSRFAPLGSLHDVVFFRRALSFSILQPVTRRPIITDLDDLPSVLARQRRVVRLHGSEATPAPARSSARSRARDMFLRSEERRWSAMEQRIIRGSDRVFVCNASDREILGHSSRIALIPNGFDPPSSPAGSPTIRQPPTVAFWGLMAYGPNADGARWFVREVLPHLRRQVPNVRVVIAGAGGENLGLPRSDDVTVLGFVPDLRPVLEATDVAIVPLRLGVGTRIKILEAWAHRIPVVATSVGGYGLCDRPGDGALLADTADEFATAIQLLLVDANLRRSLVERGSSKAADLQWQAVEERVASLLSDVLNDARSSQ